MKTLYSIVILLALTLNVDAAHLSEKLIFSARANGAQEVPEVATNAIGVASFVLNGTRDSLCIQVNLAGLSGQVTGIHLHNAPAGMNGDVVMNLTPFIMGNNLQTIVSPIDSDLLSMMINQEIYLNVHTALNPSGEIRGQVKLETDFAYRAKLDAMQETAMVMSDATGLGLFNLSLDKQELEISVAVEGLSGPITGAHLHMAAAGMDGDVVVNLTDLIDGNLIRGSVNMGLTDELISAMNGEMIYINIHTAENPGGEIRGQLMLKQGINLDSYLSNDQQVIMTTGNSSYGVGYVSINSTFDEIEYAVQTTGLEEELAAAHIHLGEPGEAGDVLTGFMVDGSAYVEGLITGDSVTEELILALLTGDSYFNFHTATNPSGEVRGQIYRLAREGYTLNLSGDQEVPAISVAGSGGGVITMDRGQSNVHYMFVMSELSGPAQAAHFHNAMAGSNGDVVYNLSDMLMGIENYDGEFGYWNASSSPAFNMENALQFRNEAIYLNIHTAENMSGELRGQVIRGGQCQETSTGINDFDKADRFKAYPNPTSNNTTIDLTGLAGSTNVELTLRDSYGRVVRSITTRPIKYRLDLSGESAGLYLIEIRANGYNSISKLIKE